MTRIPFFAVVIFLLLATLTVAEIKSLTISDDSRPLILFQKFRFTSTGHLTISVSSVSVSSPSSSSIPDSSGLGFFILKEESLLQVLLELQLNPSFCILDSHYILHLFTFPNQSQFNQSYLITSPNDYSLFYANCIPETSVSMKIQTEMYNLDPNGSKDYLSVGSTQLPGLYFIFSLCYLTFFTLWVYLCYKDKQIIQGIHLLMATLLLMKALTLICTTEVTHYVKISGTARGWNIPFYIFQFIGNVLLFTVIVLIGTGWSFLKPKLQGKKKKLLMIVIPLQVLANIASIVIGETGPYDQNWVLWNQISFLVDITCVFVIIFSMVWWMCCQRKTSIKVVKNLSVFRRFYVLVIVYFLFSRIGVFALDWISDYKHQWMSNAAEEIASLAFYVLMFYMFRPMETNKYFDVDDEEDEEAAKLALNEVRV